MGKKPTTKKGTDLICILRPNGRIIGCSRAWLSLMEYTPECQPRFDLQELLSPGQENRWQRILAKLQTHAATSALLCCRTPSGKRLYLQGRFAPATPALPQAIRATFQDITNTYRAKQLSRQCLGMLQKMAAENRAAMVVFHGQGRICYWSPQAADLFGYDGKEAFRQNIQHILDPLCDQNPAGQQWPPLPWKASADPPHDMREITCRCKDGSTITVDLLLANVDTGTRTYTIGLFMDRRRQHARDHRMEKMAYYDQLTGLPNRALLHDRLEQSLAEAKRFEHPLAVLFIDLDRFKQINDSLGHATGDQLLRMAGQRLQQCLRGNDTVARLGGDEFIIILSGFKHSSNIPKILHKILSNLSKDYLVSGHRLIVTASIGVAIFPDDGTSAERLMRNADTAMYVAKEDRGNSYQLYSEEMNQALMAQLELETHLRRAVDNWEFYLLFQPRYNLSTRDIIGIEALLRWRQPDGTSLPPETFLPHLEEMGLMVPLGNSILRKACEFCASLQKPGMLRVPVAVNLSSSQFRQRQLDKIIAAVLNDTGLSADCLELEIDELTLQKTEGRAESILHSVRNLGVSWTLDNFGLGYTSLHRLKTLPFDYLKIDRHFIKNLPDSQSDAAMIGAILALARNLNLIAIAEGIENYAQHHLLLGMGCRCGQGFLFQKPCLPVTLQNALNREFDTRASSSLVKPALLI